MKQVKFIMAVALLSILMATGLFAAEDKGPAEIVLKSTIDPAKKTKLAFFPHSVHQEVLSCGDCHHTKDANGKQVAYVEGQVIEKCESCHNTKAGMNEKLDTFKEAAHAKCKECHKSMTKEGKNTGPTKCTGCHKKDLK